MRRRRRPRLSLSQSIAPLILSINTPPASWALNGPMTDKTTHPREAATGPGPGHEPGQPTFGAPAGTAARRRGAVDKNVCRVIRSFDGFRLSK